jgi:integrase/recombinase XerC/integrase/recombinase XerD
VDPAPAPEAPPPPLRLSLAELQRHLDRFEAEFLGEKSRETVGTYRRALHEFERFVAQRQAGGAPLAFDEAGVAAYKKHLVDVRALSQVSVSTYLTALRRFGQYLVAAGLLAENPARAVKGNRRPDAHSRGVLTEADVAQLFERTPAASLLDLRDRALMALMLHAGLAEIELVRADVADLEHNLLGWFLRVQGKGRTTKDQQVQLDAPAAEPLEAYLDARGRGSAATPLFTGHGRRAEGTRLNTRSVRARVNTRLRAAGLKRADISPHSLTHTAALLWLAQGVPVEEVRRRMRHGTLDTTMIYFRKQGLVKRPAAEP